MTQQRQKGLALVTVLLIMALLSLLVAGMLRSHQLLLGGVTQQIEATRLLQLAHGAERRVLGQLRQAVVEVVQVTHGGQHWARPQAFTLGQGRVRTQLEDLSARYNLGALLAPKTPDPILLERWERLCRSLQIEPPVLDSLMGKPLLDITQLRALPEVSAAVMERLRPWVVALPKEARLNINTAPAQVLAALEDLSPDVARRLVAGRPEEGYARVDQFLALPQMEGLGVTSRGLTVNSQWFRLEVQVELGGRRMYLYSDLEIDLNTHQVRVVRRVFSAVREQMPNE
ncbi:general secretion pathway protein GspK [Pseudomonas guariconensis]|uniref:general secretion pathway protein GspK n=1 Tax=Pseudomonas guariconensis TaxID=1288410 RepID=UPI0018AC8143|nr:type II secretion system protein GspK [Pseudomonas guariconensis]MBF8721129.1 general secretion pathway protein GspK [Pseudomonas guariconensis]